ncbi:sodium-dependent bicarbonate transport family permease [Rhodopseudomonas palustris]|uniref:Sodium-dependent bicarbonate transport family permease n=1 Tax=Rhodopseudomonas palustris TaxID=1076 RepID=A0A323UAQ3_RHOPL|nr:sodium-dependent bicarbonate transport family permease [Rhodopseudomonas palustris]PZA09875.1 sodium-dependent bicarbonate transport family permease [Rhodopseudomonas palustris]
MQIFDLASANLLSPMVLFFGLGLIAALLRSDLGLPEQISKFLALYLLMSIGFRGGAEVAHHGFSSLLVLTMMAGVLLSATVPIIAYIILRRICGLDSVDAAAVAGHYGSISAVTFLAVTGALTQLSIPFDGWLVAVAAAMETPAIFTALMIAHGRSGDHASSERSVFREIALHGSIVMLVGAFVIGAISGNSGMTMLKPFVSDLFPGLLCLFLLDLGLVAGRWLTRGWSELSPATTAFGLVMPLIGAALASVVAMALGLSSGSAAVLITLTASASYIAAPAAMRLALPRANPAIALTLSLGITFPFNLIVGIPLYIALATHLTK